MVRGSRGLPRGHHGDGTCHLAFVKRGGGSRNSLFVGCSHRCGPGSGFGRHGSLCRFVLGRQRRLGFRSRLRSNLRRGFCRWCRLLRYRLDGGFRNRRTPGCWFLRRLLCDRRFDRRLRHSLLHRGFFCHPFLRHALCASRFGRRFRCRLGRDFLCRHSSRLCLFHGRRLACRRGLCGGLRRSGRALGGCRLRHGLGFAALDGGSLGLAGRLGRNLVLFNLGSGRTTRRIRHIPSPFLAVAAGSYSPCALHRQARFWNTRGTEFPSSPRLRLS